MWVKLALDLSVLLHRTGLWTWPLSHRQITQFPRLPGRPIRAAYSRSMRRGACRASFHDSKLGNSLVKSGSYSVPPSPHLPLLPTPPSSLELPTEQSDDKSLWSGRNGVEFDRLRRSGGPRPGRRGKLGFVQLRIHTSFGTTHPFRAYI